MDPNVRRRIEDLRVERKQYKALKERLHFHSFWVCCVALLLCAGTALCVDIHTPGYLDILLSFVAGVSGCLSLIAAWVCRKT